MRGIAPLTLLGMLLVFSGCDSNSKSTKKQPLPVQGKLLYTPQAQQNKSAQESKTKGPNVVAQRPERNNETEKNQKNVIAQKPENNNATKDKEATVIAKKPEVKKNTIEALDESSFLKKETDLIEKETIEESKQITQTPPQQTGEHTPGHGRTTPSGTPNGDPKEKLLKSAVVTEGDYNYKRVTFESLSGFEYQMAQDSYSNFEVKEKKEYKVPDYIQALAGKRVVVDGYMLPVTFEKGETTKFLLLGFQVGCCFGQIPRLNELVVVKMKTKKGVPVLPSYIRCQAYGIIEVEKKMVEEDKFESLYRLVADKVTEMPSSPVFPGEMSGEDFK